VFDFKSLTIDDYNIAMAYLGQERAPDVSIMPDGHPYLYRWHLKPRDRTGATGNLYFHIQVADDPERPHHDHPWENMSVILAGGYRESVLMGSFRSSAGEFTPMIDEITRLPGDVIFRKASDAHHLRLLPGELYSMSQFATGPKVREWGFWCPDGLWVPANDVIENTADGRSLYRGPRG